MTKPFTEVVAELTHTEIKEYEAGHEKYLFLAYTVFTYAEERITDERADEAEELIEERIKKEKICL